MQKAVERLGQLKHELETGKAMLAELEARAARLRDSLLRISGAIQVLEELMPAEAEAAADPASESLRMVGGAA